MCAIRSLGEAALRRRLAMHWAQRIGPQLPWFDDTPAGWLHVAVHDADEYGHTHSLPYRELDCNEHGHAHPVGYGDEHKSTNKTASDDHQRLLAGGGGGGSGGRGGDRTERRQQIADIFCISMAAVFVTMAWMTVLHKGPDAILKMLTAATPWQSFWRRAFVVVKLGTIVFAATLSQWYTDPEWLSFIGMWITITLVVMKVVEWNLFLEVNHAADGDGNAHSHSQTNALHEANTSAGQELALGHTKAEVAV